MAAFDELDLHGVPPDAGRVGYLLREALEQARRKHLGLRIIHGRGEGIMAALVADTLTAWGVEHQRGVLNPGETRVEARDLQRSRGY